ncbi:MAG TPA: hypothetical protein VGG54_22775 [Trebonia sp.]|jgi:hypothetical protein
MTTPDRDHCPTPAKGAYPDITSAVTGAEIIAEHHPRPLHPYECKPGCGLWHLTSQPRTGAAIGRLAATDDGTWALLELDRIRRTVIGVPKPGQRRRGNGERRPT